MLPADPSSAGGFELAKNITVKQYREWETAAERDKLADFVIRRFGGRYFEPLERLPNNGKSGFSIIAICCLSIEAYESFKRGWENTKNRSELAFCSFFDTEARFAVLQGLAATFYKHVRCGILHQVETTGGWRIHLKRQGAIFEPDTLIVNGEPFLEAMRLTVGDYADKLRLSAWDAEIWQNFRKKNEGSNQELREVRIKRAASATAPRECGPCRKMKANPC